MLMWGFDVPGTLRIFNDDVARVPMRATGMRNATPSPPRDNNLAPPVSLSIQEYGLSPFFLIPSLLIVIFAALTHQLHEMKLMDNALDYSEESESQAGVWTPFLWTTATFAHAAIYLRLTSPIDLFQLAVAIALSIMCLSRLCLPRHSPRKEDAASTSIAAPSRRRHRARSRAPRRSFVAR